MTTTPTKAETDDVMRTYEPSAGTRIERACQEAIALAVKHQDTVSFSFNGIDLKATSADTPEALVNQWHSSFEAEREAYNNSPEGKQAKAQRDGEIIRKQSELDVYVVALPKILRTDNHLDNLILWIGELVNPADDVATKWNPSEVADQLEAAGYRENEHVGQSPEWFNTRERMGRYIVGQAINCMRKGLGPHPITNSFCNKYFNLPSQPGAVEPPERIWIAPIALRTRSSAMIYDEAQREPSDVEYRRVQPEQSGERQLIERCAQQAFDAVKTMLESEHDYSALQIAASVAANVRAVGQDEVGKKERDK